MPLQARSLWVHSLLSVALLLAATARADTGADNGSTGAAPGSWQAHKYTFNFMGFTSIYSCNGLEDKLRQLLRMSGAGPTVGDIHVDSPCTRGIGRPDKLVMAYLTFSTLQPVPQPTSQPTSEPSSQPTSQSAPAPAAAPAGVWHHVTISPHHPYDFDYGDCELIEEFRATLLPMFTTRNLSGSITCVPHQDSGSNFSLSYDVFGPPRPAKKS